MKKIFTKIWIGLASVLVMLMSILLIAVIHIFKFFRKIKFTLLRPAPHGGLVNRPLEEIKNRQCCDEDKTIAILAEKSYKDPFHNSRQHPLNSPMAPRG